MKVHRIITTIEVENDNSITSIELINLNLANADILLAITDITTNGNAEDITKIYDSVNKSRLGITGKLKGIAHIINDSLDDYECGIIGRDYNDSELKTTHLVKQDDVGMTNANGVDTDIAHGDLLS